MFRRASTLLDSLDLVGVTERLEEWRIILCARSHIATCPPIGHLNHRQLRRSRLREGDCPPPERIRLRAAVHRHAAADLRLYRHAAETFATAWVREGGRARQWVATHESD